MAAESLRPIGRTGPLRGMANLVQKEWGLWFRTRRALIQLLIWSGLINGLIAIVPLLLRAVPPGEMPPMQELLGQLFLGLGNIAAGLSAIIAGQDLLIGERQSGTAAWVLSKPVSRPTFLLAKFFGNLVPLWLVAVALPAVLGLLEFRWLAAGMSVPTFLVILGLQSLTLLFYLALALALGAAFRTRGPILGATLGLLLGGSAVTSFFPKVGLILPSRLMDYPLALLLGVKVDSLYPFPLVPVLVTGFGALLLLALAVRQFGREEL